MSSISTIISDGSYLSPLVLEDKYLYLYRMWKNECAVAQFFNSSQSTSFQYKEIRKIINLLFFNSFVNTEIDWMKIATVTSIIHQKIVISGGPGTGKTSTISKIIASLSLLNNKKLHIKMIAPTGKAAAILTESINKNINNIIQIKNQYTSLEKATTIHALIGSQSYLNKTKNITYNQFTNSLKNLDLLIIDEASMISLSNFAKLILLLSEKTKIILLGDSCQLGSIEPGSVFQDICKFSNFCYSLQHRRILTKITHHILPAPFAIPPQYYHCNNNIIDRICTLKKNYRFNIHSGINKLSIAINSGNYNHALSLLHSKKYSDLCYFCPKNNIDYVNMIIYCTEKYSNYLQTLKSNKKSVTKILKKLNEYKIICVLHDGIFGTIKINYLIEQVLHEKGLIQLNKSEHYVGKPIIILKNDPFLNLSNGDIGVLLLNDQEKLSAYFLSPNNSINIIHIHQLPQHETCFAITAHKSQGSEFSKISIILPNYHTPILTKELLYTAVTRARHELSIYGTNDVIAYGINNTIRKNSRLFDKMKTSIN